MSVHGQIELVEVPILAAGIAIAGLGAWLLRRNARDAVGRAFALLLLVLGGYFALDRAGGGPRGDPFAYASTYFLLAIPFIALWFLVVYRARNAGRAPHRIWPPALGAGFLALAVPYALDRTLFIDPDGIFDFGPLWWFRAVPGVAFAAVSIVLAQDYLREERWGRRQGLFFLSLGFGIVGVTATVFPGGVGGMELLRGELDLTRDGAWAALLEIAAWYALVALFLSMVAHAVRARRPGDRWRGAVHAGGLFAAAQLPGFLGPYTPPGDDLFRFVWPLELSLGIALVLFALLGAYAALRHRALDLDARMRLGVKAGTLGAVFLAVGFVVSESAALLVGERFGAYIGIGSASLLLVGLQPLQRAAERIAAGALPEAKPVTAMDHAERVALYREQVELAWADGALTKAEKLRLERLRERLGVALEEAAEAENAAAAAG